MFLESDIDTDNCLKKLPLGNSMSTHAFFGLFQDFVLEHIKLDHPRNILERLAINIYLITALQEIMGANFFVTHLLFTVAF